MALGRFPFLFIFFTTFTITVFIATVETSRTSIPALYGMWKGELCYGGHEKHICFHSFLSDLVTPGANLLHQHEISMALKWPVRHVNTLANGEK